jgi:hypothetical protein
MVGREELKLLELRKQALVAQSDLNRLLLREDLRRLRSASSWMGEATRASRGLSPLLLLTAPLAGFLVAKASHRAGSWFSKVAGTASWVLPLYRLWKRVAVRRKDMAESQTPVG